MVKAVFLVFGVGRSVACSNASDSEMNDDSELKLQIDNEAEKGDFDMLDPQNEADQDLTNVTFLPSVTPPNTLSEAFPTLDRAELCSKVQAEILNLETDPGVAERSEEIYSILRNRSKTTVVAFDLST